MSRCDGLYTSPRKVTTTKTGEESTDPDELLDVHALREELRRLRAENESLRRQLEQHKHEAKSCHTQIKEEASCVTVTVPQQFDPIFKRAEHLVGDFFQMLEMDPRQGTIRVGEDRYILLRGSAMTVEFSKLMLSILGDKAEAQSFVKNILFDLAHSVGKSDAKNFISKMQVSDPIEKLSSGPINFAFTGWAKVDISPESTPIAGSPEGFYLLYDHPYSFEADSYTTHWEKQSEETSPHPVCTMNCGYSSGWCEESFSLRLVASEVLCRARGDSTCRFIMAHPNFIHSRVLAYKEQHPELNIYVESTIPGFFERRNKEKEGAKQVQDALDTLRSQHTMLQHERQKVLDLLHCILPERVAQKMANGEKIVAERREATILFCDIVGFTRLSAKLPPESVVLWLDSIFTKIDMICEKHGIEKIKTIGDAYMCCSGLVREQADHIERMARFALSLRDAVRAHKFRTPDTNEPVNMRIGMHTGLCVSGIIGRSRFMFDTYGDSVNTASRMESHGVPGEVQVTEEVFKALKNKFFFLPRMDGIEFKGKGFLKTYFLMGEKSDFEQDMEAMQSVAEAKSPYYHEKLLAQEGDHLRPPCKSSCSCPPNCCCKSEVMIRSDSFDTCVGVHLDSTSTSSSSSPLAPSSPSSSISSLLTDSLAQSNLSSSTEPSQCDSMKILPPAVPVESLATAILETSTSTSTISAFPCAITSSSAMVDSTFQVMPETKKSIATVHSPVSVRI